LVDLSREVGLEVNAEKTKYMLLCRHQNAGQNHDIKIANISFENVAPFRDFGTTVTNQNLIHKKIKRRLKSYNAFSIQSRIFCFLVCCKKKQKSECTKVKLCLWFYMGVKFGL
jgi:uncharacterized protein YjaG (DUF416 family)